MRSLLQVSLEQEKGEDPQLHRRRQTGGAEEDGRKAEEASVQGFQQVRGS